MKDYLRNIIQPSESGVSNYFDWFIQILIVLSILTFSIETIPDIDDDVIYYIKVFEIFSVSVFTIEYLARIYVSEKRLSYVFSFYGLIDLIAIAPFYLGFLIDLRSMKAFRLFRLLRLIKLTRYNKTLDRFQRAMRESKEDFFVFFLFTVILFYLASVGIYYFEHKAQPEVFRSIFDSMWWAVATLTTVGYGDVYPITVGGKIFTAAILIVGLGIIGIPAGIVAAALSDVDTKVGENDED